MSNGVITANIDSLVRQIRLKPHNYLFPVFETVVNSIHGIQESNNENGSIDIRVKRIPAQLGTDGKPELNSSIIGFEITDNGIGFNDENFRSFQEAYTQHKIELGCKGVGRFIALAAFSLISIESIFYDPDREGYYKRTFRFSTNGVNDHDLKPVTNVTPSTTVSLSGIKERFIRDDSSGQIADDLLRHLLLNYIIGKNPKISISDSNNASIIDLDDVFKKDVVIDDEVSDLTIEGIAFRVYFLRTKFRNFHKHLIHYCAHEREVKQTAIVELIPNLINERITVEEYSYYISVYITGAYLDENVDDLRNEFYFPLRKNSELRLYEPISMEEINDGIATEIQRRYSDLLNKLEEDKIDELKTFIYNDGLEYVHLLNHPDVLKEIRPGLKGNDLEMALHRANHNLSVRQRARVNEFISQRPEQITRKEDYKKFFHDLLRDQHDIGKSRLVQYMFHRKAILKLFGKFIEIQKSSDYKYEGDIHDIIFERKQTDNDLSFNDHNLWILDERLAYSNFIASDKPINNLKPDLFIYENKFIYGNPKEFIVIFELKRPGRKNYSDEEKDLGKQLRDQVIDIMRTGGKNELGRNLNITAETSKFGFVIADLDNQLIQHLKYVGYKPTPKGSFFKYEDGVNLFIEILSYDELLQDANLRHQSFFEHLGIDKI